MNGEITDRQALAISLIEKNLPGIKFVGSTKGDASEFIGTYMERSMDVHKKRMAKSGYPQAKKPVTPLQRTSFADNEYALNYYGLPMARFYGEKILVMPDMTLAYIPDEWE